MGEITVKGLGKIRIAGDVPTEEESRVIMEAAGVKEQPQIPVPDGGPADKLLQKPLDTLTEDTTPALTSMTRGVVTRPGAEAVGGTIGAAVGEPAGPVGMVGGAALGAGAGSAAFDTADAALRMVTGQGPRKEEMADPTIRALMAGKSELMWTGGASALVPALKMIGPRVLGVASKGAKDLAATSKRMGIPLGSIHASESKAVKGVSRVLGVFPFVGTPVREAATEGAEAVGRKYGKILNELAPNATIADLGVDLTTAAAERYGKFRSVASVLYDRFYKKAAALPVADIFPTKNAVRVATELTGEVKAGDIVLTSGKGLQSPLPKVLDDYIENLTKLPEHITAEQYRQLQRDLQDVMTTMQKDGYDVSRAFKLKKALEVDFNSPDITRLDPKTGKDIVDSLMGANKFYAETITRFQTPTAKRFGRVDKKMFGAGPWTPGTINEDEVFKAVFNAKSPQAVNDLRQIVGPEKFRAAGRRFFETAYEGALVTKGDYTFLDGDKFRATIGLGSKDGEQVLGSILKGTGLSPQTLEKFSRVADAVAGVPIPNTSVFIQRRLMLGGAASAISFVNAPVSTVAAIITARYGAKLLSSPKMLDIMVKATDDTLSDKARRALLIRVARQFGDEQAQEIDQANRKLSRHGQGQEMMAQPDFGVQ